MFHIKEKMAAHRRAMMIMPLNKDLCLDSFTRRFYFGTIDTQGVALGYLLLAFQAVNRTNVLVVAPPG